MKPAIGLMVMAMITTTARAGELVVKDATSAPPAPATPPMSDDWLAIEAPVATGLWSGVMPAISLYRRDTVLAVGLALLGAIAQRWQHHPEWLRVRVEPHSGIRGDAESMLQSQRRAEQTRDALLRHGFGPDRIDAIGYGRMRPRTVQAGAPQPGDLRVELVIERAIDSASVP